eukprot:CAMPEP_0202918992 /NCGR_PEP_ID=MMETSP1392-20130828/74721_1 /ASSEMBLY_ACC=CAM_ASM_000868 /TAXON_ID=225041 /ORGANISM="Chlamydomonas chlamydogama, Strain SAG 11-48b" /LENGTH=83 /DNA_ID=CAMNT_0049612191 /DNA_START=101 /DNA_END=352 /DNA_ORIENTATION=+
MTAAPESLKERQQKLRQLPYDQQRTAVAQQQRLSVMIKDMLDGTGERHWNAAMRGTLIPHPNQENKTQGLDNERAAAAAGKRA